MNRIIASGPDPEAIEDIFGHLAILNHLHGQVAERFEVILVERDVDSVDATAALEGS